MKGRRSIRRTKYSKTLQLKFKIVFIKYLFSSHLVYRSHYFRNLIDLKAIARKKSKDPTADYILNVSKKLIQISEQELKRVVVLSAAVSIKNTL